MANFSAGTPACVAAGLVMLATSPQAQAAGQATIVIRAEPSPTEADEAFGPASANGSAQYPHRIEMTAESGEQVVLEYEIVSDPDAALFYSLYQVAIGKDGTQYYLDEGDNNIKVLSPDNEHLFSFGGEGQAPGEWLGARAISISPDDRVYVWDQDLNAFHVFERDGSFLYRVYHPGRGLTLRHVVWVSDDELFAGALSMEPGYHRYYIHRLRIDSEDSRRVLRRTDSFGEVPDYTPGLYMILAGGWLTQDIDGNLLFAARTQHRVEKYTPQGSLLWRVSDPDVLPNAGDQLEATPTGRIRVGRYAQSAGLFPSTGRIIHQVFREATGVPPRPEEPRIIQQGDFDPSQIKMHKIIELIDRDDPERSRILVRTTEDFMLKAIDGEGTIYGIIKYADPIPIRGRLLISPAQQ